MYNILVTCFNASLYIRRCLDTLRFQTFADWRCYVMDDLSTDDSLEVARAAVDGDDRFVFIKNSTKHYQIGNYVAAISRFDDEDVCITVDGDDWLPDRNVLQRVHNAYQDGAWMTWGSHLVFEPNGNVYRGQGEPLYDPATLRCEKWFPSHLRTWKTFLWRRITMKICVTLIPGSIGPLPGTCRSCTRCPRWRGTRCLPRHHQLLLQLRQPLGQPRLTT